jgi:Tol biopolymer transport system component
LNNSKVRRLTTSGKHIKNLAWAPNGREIIFCSNRDCLYRLWRISISGGEPERLNLGARDINWISVSRSSNRLAYSESVKNAYIYTAEIFKQARAEIKPRLFNPSTRTENFPAYSPDEERIAFASARTGCMEIWTCKRDGSDLVSLTSLNSLSGAPQWSPDGQWIVFDSRPLGNSDILIVDANGVQPPRHLTTHPSEDGMPTWSHDGQWIYFGSNRTGDWRIHKIHLESGDVIQVTQNESYFGFESPDKKWFYFKKKYENWGPVYKFNLKTHEQSIAVQDSTGVFAWAIATESIVYITFDSDGNQILKRYNTLSEKAERLGKFVQDMKINLSISDVSNDGHALLMWGNFVTSRSSDIFLVENFE